MVSKYGWNHDLSTEEGLRAYHREWRREFRKREPEKVAKYTKAYREANPHYHRDYKREKRKNPQVRERHNKTQMQWRKQNPERYMSYPIREYQEWEARFGPDCWICKRARVGKKRLAREHCHFTGDACGLAHIICNVLFGVALKASIKDPFFKSNFIAAWESRLEALKGLPPNAKAVFEKKMPKLSPRKPYEKVRKDKTK